MKSLLSVTLLLLFSCSPAMGQDHNVLDEKDVDASQYGRYVDLLGNQQLEFNRSRSNFVQRIFWSANNNAFAAKDGNYLAQNEEELQTYYDLKMGYQYIESDTIRKVLNLESDQGIIIESCDKAGAGYVAGFREGDVVLKVDDKPVKTQYEFVIAITSARENKEGSAIVRRAGSDVELEFTIAPVKIEKKYRWIIGVSVDEMSELLKTHLGINGAVVTTITEDSPAEKMSIKVNDIITRIDGDEIGNLADLKKAVQKAEGEPVTLDLLRAGNRMTLELTPKKIEDNSGKQWFTPAINHYYQLQPNETTGYFMPTTVVDTLVSETKPAETGTMESLSRQVEELRQLVEELKESIEK